MSSRTRVLVMSLSAPVLAFAVVGGLLGKVAAGEDTYRHLKMFEDVVQLIDNNYVEEVDVSRVMDGALHGLADNLDAESAFLTAAEVGEAERGDPLPAAELGITLTRQYYLRVIAVRDGSPAAQAGLHTGDYIRAIDDKPTRDMSVWEGVRALHGAPGSAVRLTVFRSNQNDLHELELTRAVPTTTTVSGRIAAPGIGYLRVAAIGPSTVTELQKEAATLTKAGASKLVLDIRRTSTGTFDEGVALARLFVGSGTLAIRETKGGARETIAAAAGDGAVTAPLQVLIDTGTSGPAEVFVSALAGNKRADLIGEHTIGRAAEQSLVKLPDGSGLWLSTARFLQPSGSPLHNTGVEPDVEVLQPRADFGQPEPDTDPILDKALERAAGSPADRAA